MPPFAVLAAAAAAALVALPAVYAQYSLTRLDIPETVKIDLPPRTPTHISICTGDSTTLTLQTPSEMKDTELDCANADTMTACVGQNREASNRCFWLSESGTMKCINLYVAKEVIAQGAEGASLYGVTNFERTAGRVKLFGEKGVLAPADVCGSNPWICAPDLAGEGRTRRKDVPLRFLDEATYCERVTVDWRPACNTKAIAKAMDAYTPASDQATTCDSETTVTSCHQQNSATSVRCIWTYEMGCYRVYAWASSAPARDVAIITQNDGVWLPNRTPKGLTEKQFCDEYTYKAADDEGTTSLYSWQPIWISWLSVAGLYTVVGGWLLVVSF